MKKMSMSSKRDKRIAKAESELKRHQNKSGRPTDNAGERYVTGMEGLRTQGKGGRYRVLKGWYSDEMKEKFDKIFDKRQKEYKDNSTATPPPEFDEKKTK